MVTHPLTIHPPKEKKKEKKDQNHSEVEEGDFVRKNKYGKVLREWWKLGEKKNEKKLYEIQHEIQLT